MYYVFDVKENFLRKVFIFVFIYTKSVVSEGWNYKTSLKKAKREK